MYHLLGTLIISLSIQTESRVVLSPSGEVSVCPGGQLSFRCSTNLTYLEWNITVSQSGKPKSGQQLVTAVTQFDLDLLISGHVFNITRNSPLNSYPLVSVLTIANAVFNLTATKIKCMEMGLSSLSVQESSSAAIINIINIHPDPPNVEIPRVLTFTTESVIVYIDWIQSQHHENVVYNVDAIPQVTVTSTNSISTKLQVSYNTQYNVSITAILCGHRNATTIVVLNKFVKCVHPLDLPMIDHSMRASLNNDPAVLETNATFSCLPGLEFRGPYKSTCMENGEWEPDPREVDCLADCGPPSLPPSGYIFPYTSTINGAVVNFACQRSVLNQDENITVIVAVCNEQGKWDPDPAEFCTRASATNQDALIAVAVVSSIVATVIVFLLFTTIFYCGYFRRKHKSKKRKKPRPRKPTPPPKELYYNLRPYFEQDNSMELQPKRPMYDDIIPPSEFDLPPKSNRAIVMYDDILSPSEQDLKEQNVSKPKIMYDEVLPPYEQDNRVELKRNTAYRPADMK